MKSAAWYKKSCESQVNSIILSDEVHEGFMHGDHFLNKDWFEDVTVPVELEKHSCHLGFEDFHSLRPNFEGGVDIPFSIASEIEKGILIKKE